MVECFQRIVFKLSERNNEEGPMKRRLAIAMILVGALSLGTMTGCGEMTRAIVNAAMEEAAQEASESTVEETAQDAAESSDAADAGSGESAVERFARVTKDETELDPATEAETGGTPEFDENSIMFTTVDLDGKPVTQDIFADADLTVVHVWGTFCGPCIQEMPEYAEFYQNMPDNVNLIGIVCDVSEGDAQGVQSAKDIMNDAGAGFQNLCVSDSVEPLVADFQFVPSVFFVDKNGHLVGDIMDGAAYPDMEAQLSALME